MKNLFSLNDHYFQNDFTLLTTFLLHIFILFEKGVTLL